MSTFRLSKSKILAGLQCPKRLYLQTHHPELVQESASAQARFAQGNLLGEVARTVYEDGILIGHDDIVRKPPDPAGAGPRLKPPLTGRALASLPEASR